MPSNIVAPRVLLTDPVTGLISREWYQFFLTLFELTGAGSSVTSITDLEVGPSPVDVGEVTVLLSQLSASPSDSPLVSQFSEILKTLQGLQEAPSASGLIEMIADLSNAILILQGLLVSPPIIIAPDRAVFTAVQNLDFPNTAAQTSSDATISVPGVVKGDVVALGVPDASVLRDSCYTAWVSVADTVDVRFNNYSVAAQDPPAGDFRAVVTRY